MFLVIARVGFPGKSLQKKKDHALTTYTEDGQVYLGTDIVTDSLSL